MSRYQNLDIWNTPGTKEVLSVGKMMSFRTVCRRSQSMSLWNRVCASPEYKKFRNMPHLRRGQALMNALYLVDENVYHGIRGTEADVFYVDTDKRMEMFRRILESKE